MKNPFVVISTNRPQIVGPFNSEALATRWGEAWQKSNNDDPRWQVIDMDQEWFYDGADIMCQPYMLTVPVEGESYVIIFSASWDSDMSGNVWTGKARDIEHAFLLALVDSIGWDEDSEKPGPACDNEHLRTAIHSQFADDMAHLREITMIFAAPGELAPYVDIDPDKVLKLDVPRVTHETSGEQH